jgi:Bacterial protein of unknown function (DUF899)
VAPPAHAVTDPEQAQRVLGPDVGTLDLVECAEGKLGGDLSAVERPVEPQPPEFVQQRIGREPGEARRELRAGIAVDLARTLGVVVVPQEHEEEQNDVGMPVFVGLALVQVDRVFLTYSTTGRGNEPVNGSLGLLDMTPYGRREAWEDNPEGWPEAPQADSPVGGHGSPICWYWRSDADGVATWGPTSRPVPQWTRRGATPVETLGRQGHHH